jgi:hypothetical protein
MRTDQLQWSKLLAALIWLAVHGGDHRKKDEHTDPDLLHWCEERRALSIVS